MAQRIKCTDCGRFVSGWDQATQEDKDVLVCWRCEIVANHSGATPITRPRRATWKRIALFLVGAVLVALAVIGGVVVYFGARYV